MDIANFDYRNCETTIWGAHHALIEILFCSKFKIKSQDQKFEDFVNRNYKRTDYNTKYDYFDS